MLYIKFICGVLLIALCAYLAVRCEFNISKDNYYGIYVLNTNSLPHDTLIIYSNNTFYHATYDKGELQVRQKGTWYYIAKHIVLNGYVESKSKNETPGWDLQGYRNLIGHIYVPVDRNLNVYFNKKESF